MNEINAEIVGKDKLCHDFFVTMIYFFLRDKIHKIDYEVFGRGFLLKDFSENVAWQTEP